MCAALSGVLPLHRQALPVTPEHPCVITLVIRRSPPYVPAMTQSGQRGGAPQQDVAGRKDTAAGRPTRARAAAPDDRAETAASDVDERERRRLRAAVLKARSPRLQLPASVLVLRRARAARSA